VSETGARHLVLVGAGHAHVEVLRAFGRNRPCNMRMTLITREAASPYSGMLPGAIAGHYRRDETEIQVAPLARFAGAELIVDEVTSLDAQARLVHRKAGPPIAYDFLSLDIGSTPNIGDVPGAAAHAIPVKPIDGFFARFDRLHADVLAGRIQRLALVGGGAGGVELLLAVAHRLRRDRPGQPLELTLISGSERILDGFSAGFRRRIEAALAEQAIAVVAGARAVGVSPNGVTLASGRFVAADAVLWTTQASPASFLADAGLECDEHGFLLVDEMLRAKEHPEISAAGDMIAFAPRALPKAGVYAVRAGPVLAHNLRASLAGTGLSPFRPQRRALVILATGPRHAVATGYGFTLEGDWVWRWKDRIDRRFMARFRVDGSEVQR
jgi:selenide,water dikinase